MTKLTVVGEAKVSAPIVAAAAPPVFEIKEAQVSPGATPSGGGNVAIQPAQGTGERPPPAAEVRFAPGTEGDPGAMPSDVEDSGNEYPQDSNGDSGGGGGGDQYAEGTPGDGSSATDTNQTQIVSTGKQALVTSTGFMSKFNALPLPVKLIGGAAVAYVFWRLLK